MTPEQFKAFYSREIYLGDGLYAHFDGYQIWLRAPRTDGDHEVALELQVFDALVAYREQIYKDAKLIERKENE
jgi:hypothetical protein